MKAPDKVYIGRRNYGPLIGGWELQPFTSKEIESIEYIRKDALMEWAKGEIMPGNSAEGKGWNWALQTLIEKIETL